MIDSMSQTKYEIDGTKTVRLQICKLLSQENITQLQKKIEWPRQIAQHLYTTEYLLAR